MIPRLLDLIARKTICRKECGNAGWHLLRRETLRIESITFLGEPALRTIYDDRMRCHACRQVTRQVCAHIELSTWS